MNMRDVQFRETCRCPSCRRLINTEYLTYVTQTGEVVGCSFCIQPKS